MLRKLFTLTILSSLFFCNCRAQDTMPNEYKKKQIVFGNGGGFTGMTSTYFLLKDGRLFQENMDSTYTQLTKLERKQTRGYFKRLKKLKLKDLNLNSPGNLYHFLEYRKRDYSYKAIWGGENKPPEDCEALQIELIQLVRDLNAKDKPEEETEEDNTK